MAARRGVGRGNWEVAMRSWVWAAITAACMLFSVATPAQGAAAQEEQLSPEQQHVRNVLNSLKWVEGPATVGVGNNATLRVPEGYVFLDAGDTKKFQELNENISSGNEYTLAPADLHWFALFEYEDTGYVKDDEKIDADALLESIKQGTEAANEERRKRGWEEMQITGWRVRPAYNESTKRLEWAIDAQSASGASTNLFTKILGRHGVTSVALVTSPDSLAADAPQFRDAIRGFEYVEGQRYAEFREGDKVAEYGLAGLIAGGTVAVAAKSGLLKGLWKFLAIGAVALAASAKGLIARFRKS
jgi:uncharacterized membrane-anchored protein